jgi:hypothetical protein
MTRRKLLFSAVYVLFILVITELCVRTYWALIGGSFLDAPNRMHLRWQPELKGIEAQRGDGAFDVLLLGGSVMKNVGDRIRTALDQVIAEPVHVYNVAGRGHTSWDSRSKYQHLADARFDLVLYYQAINEARANNCPPEVFREDYTHYAWYRGMQAYDSGGERYLTLPFTLEYIRAKVAPQIGLATIVPKHVPRDEWLDYGSDIRTGPCFRRNLNWIADTAVRRGDPFVALVFASFVPPGYTDRKFIDKQLGLVDGGQPTILWGRTENVVKAIAVHNEAVLDLRERKDVSVVDMRTVVPAEPRYWRDICHMSDEGRGIWVAALVGALDKRGLLSPKPQD